MDRLKMHCFQCYKSKLAFSKCCHLKMKRFLVYSDMNILDLITKF